MSKTLEGMARAFDATSLDYHGQEPSAWVDQADVAGMKAAILWLADNVSDEMVIAANSEGNGMAAKLSAALRAAAGGGDK